MVSEVLEGEMKGGLAATGSGGSAKRGCRGLYRGGNECEGGSKERTSETYRGAEPVRGFPNDAKNMGKSGRSSLLARDPRGRGTSDGAVRLRIPPPFESAAHNGRYGVGA